MLYDALINLLGEDGADILARVLAAVLILILTALVRRLVGVLARYGTHRLTRWTQSDWDDRIAEALVPPIRLLILVVGVEIAALALNLPNPFAYWLRTVLNTLVAYSIFWALYRLTEPVIAIAWALSRRTVSDVALSQALEEKLSRVLVQIVRALIIVLGFAVVLESWGYDVAGLVTGLGIGGLAVALAAQDTLANLFGYFVILADEPFRVGEYIVFGDVSGTVEHIGFRSTRLRAVDQSLIAVPNSTLMNATIINWSRLTKRRLKMTLGLEYTSSPQQILAVVQTIREMLRAHEQVQADSVIVQFVEFNESSLDVLIVCYMKVTAWADFQAAKQDINLRIMRILAEHGVGMAFPTRTVFLEHAQHAEPPSVAASEELPPEEPPSAAVRDRPVPDDAEN